ncbi:hypothetical protein [Methanoculleus chikugoensis]|uniref:hypothetical protein n=1 Tax=Methanoculleus chikugoensis TaxID=118126 RepID=UPI001FB2AF62|nr:hypothetical protein [Methanoculleus chikugoensis]
MVRLAGGDHQADIDAGESREKQGVRDAVVGGDEVGGGLEVDGLACGVDQLKVASLTGFQRVSGPPETIWTAVVPPPSGSGK